MFIKQIEMRELRMRLLNPFETSFGVTQDRRIVLVKVTNGTSAGYGEVTAGEGPFYSHETSETAWHVLRDFIIPKFVGKEIARVQDFASLVRGIRGHNMAKAGLETALWDLQAKAGYRRIKIKIKPGWDLEVVRQARAAFPNLALMGDANSAYTLADAGVFKNMDKYNLMMFEQPLHYEDLIDHAELQKQIDTPICLDESIHSAEDARKAIKIGACKIINIKLGRVGGHTESRAVHDVCRDNGIPVWCGGMLESGIGRKSRPAVRSRNALVLEGLVITCRRIWSSASAYAPRSSPHDNLRGRLDLSGFKSPDPQRMPRC